MTDISTAEMWDVFFKLIRHLDDRFGFYEAYEKTFMFLWRFYPDVFGVAVSEGDYMSQKKKSNGGERCARG